MNTEEARYLAYIYTPYEQNPRLRVFLGDGDSDLAELPLRAISRAKGTLVSYELPTLAPFFGDEQLALPPQIIDLTEAARLIRGRPASSPDHCAIWNLLRRETQHGAAAIQLQSLIFRHCGREDEGGYDVVPLMVEFLRGVRELWLRTRDQLETSGELGRFEAVEQPVGIVLLNAQKRGIRFDRFEVNRRLGELGTAMARSAAALRANWNVRRATDSSQLVQALGYDKRVRVDEVLRQPALAIAIRARLDAALDLLPKDHALAGEIKRFRASSHDKSILLNMSARVADRVHPPFTVMGTVTGRALARTPALQYLSRSTRSVLCADEGKQLLYPDFSQFEPGILAEDSGDERLRQDFNTDDLYVTLSQRVFGATDRRKEAKLVFLSFCYGMSAARAAELIAPDPGATSDVESLIATFFEEYSRLEAWRRGIYAQLERDGRIGSRYGNYRYRVRVEGSLNSSERRWSMSQRIQGTASLILKRAMLRVDSAGIAELLLPMHDAALYQVDATTAEEAKARIEREFVSAFVDECPHLKPRVKFEEFAGAATPSSA